MAARKSAWGLRGNVPEAGERKLLMNQAFQLAILAIPVGEVSTYGRVAEAAGYPRHHRAVARMLRTEDTRAIPWHRVIGADGALKTSGASAAEQARRLREEGVVFCGSRVDLARCLHEW